jgi:EAL domain-containing protein (putative c-di-GMP-specific phosphodiesterase class I)
MQEPGGTLLSTADVDALERLTDASSYADAVHRLLTVARTHTRMSIAWVSEFVGTDQVLRFVDCEPGTAAPAEGSCMPLDGTYCARVLDGSFPPLIPDARRAAAAALLDLSPDVNIGAYIGVPLLGPTGAAVGMLCAVDPMARTHLEGRDLAALQLLAQVLHDLQQRAVTAQESQQERRALRSAVTDVLAGTGRHPVLQPIVDLTTGRVYAVEGLTRFTAPSPAQPGEAALRSPAQWFDDASRLDLREDLDLATAEAVLDLLDTVPPDVAVTINLGPATLVTERVVDLLAGRELHRIVVEITEHAPVADYAALAAALRPYRDRGLRLAVDDAGAGYASLCHVLSVDPDLVKIDMALTRGADTDLARRTLLRALASFADGVGCRLVAEGVETEAELATIADCGISLVQGYVLAPPSERPAWGTFDAVEQLRRAPV